jgi:hypothetical protein
LELPRVARALLPAAFPTHTKSRVLKTEM